MRIQDRPGAASTARFRENEILVRLSGRVPAGGRTEAIGRALSRAVGREHLGALQSRVAELNRSHFRVPVRKVSLRNNRSTWGSCSRAGNLSFATRLLLAPHPILDYVCVHELAHRIVANHSPAFWARVRQALPDYQERRRWLRRHGEELGW